MRQDQYLKLQDLHERLIDVFLLEAEPNNWPGAGMVPSQMDAKTRGDAYWCKKNAVATIALTQRVQSLVTHIQQKTAGEQQGDPAAVDETDDDLDRQVADAEKEASKLLARMHDPAAKANYDRKVHGKT